MRSFMTGLFLLSLCLSGAIFAGTPYKKTTNGVTIKVSGDYLSIRFCTDNILHFVLSDKPDYEPKSIVVDKKWGAVKFTSTDSSDYVILKSKAVKLTVSKNDGSSVLYDKSGAIVLRTGPVELNSIKPNPVTNDSLYEVVQNFVITPDEGLYGLGQFQDGIMNYRGQDLYLVQANRTAINPFLTSTNRYGIYWDAYCETFFSEHDNQMQLKSTAARCINYYVVVGENIDAEIKGYREITGKAPMNAKWTYGYWQSKERYASGAELIRVVNEFRTRHIPIDAIVQDWNYWPDAKHYSGMAWDTVHYPAIEKTIDSLHTIYHAHLMASIWPCLGMESPIYKDLAEHGCIYPHRHWSEGKLYDCYNPVARDIYWKHLNAGLFSKGVDAFWMDGSEPELTSSADPYITGEEIISLGKNYFGSFREFLNPYSLYHTKGVYEHQRKTSEEKRVFILTRSVFSGQQRYAAATWSGDIGANWRVLRNQISAGINFCMSGTPYWCADIGGFLLDSQGGMYPEGGTEPAYRELYVRWFQFGAFCPLFRSHGTQYPREPWQFGDNNSENYKALVKFDNLRYQLMPYIYSSAWQITKNGSTLMRGLPMDFPGDKKAYSVDNQFMFGPALLVCPVTNPIQYKTKKTVDFIPAKNLMSLDGKKGCLDVDYFAGKDSVKSALHCNIVELAVTWNGQLPDQLVSVPYSVRMDGYLLIDDVQASYTFNVATSGAVRFILDGKTIINAPDNAALATFSAKAVFAEAGRHRIQIIHYQPKPGECSFKFEWANSHNAEKLSSVLTSYLPKNNNGWIDFWTNERIAGGKMTTRDVPLDIMPLYVKAGSIIPFGHIVQSTSERQDDTLEIRVYTGNDCNFVLFEDEGDSYRYEKGVYSEIPISWNEAQKELTIGKRAGTFPGMKQERYFKVTIIDGGESSRAANGKVPGKMLHYNGKPIREHFSF